MSTSTSSNKPSLSGILFWSTAVVSLAALLSNRTVRRELKHVISSYFTPGL